MIPHAARPNIGKRGTSPLYNRPSLHRTALLFKALDDASRHRKLSDEESEALEQSMRSLGMI